MSKGWKYESARHSLARKGIKTGNQNTSLNIKITNTDKEIKELKLKLLEKEFQQLRAKRDKEEQENRAYTDTYNDLNEKMKSKMNEYEKTLNAEDDYYLRDMRKRISYY